MISEVTTPKANRPTDGPGAWEPFENHTHNGRYWALHRWNSRWWGGVQVMNTRNGQPRRFGSQGTAQKAADEANKAGA